MSLSALFPDWVDAHASQVSSMLPGGLEVLGIYIINSKDPRKTLENAAHHLFALEKREYRYAIHINTSSSKKTCWQYRQSKADHTPCELKWLKTVPRFKFFQSLVEFSVPTVDLDSIHTDLDHCMAVVTEQDEVEFYSKIQAEKHQEFRIFGCLDVFCYVNEKEKDMKQLAIEFIKQDYQRTLKARIDIMKELESMEGSFPKRIRMQCLEQIMSSCYALPDESIEEAVANASEILNLSEWKGSPESRESFQIAPKKPTAVVKNNSTTPLLVVLIAILVAMLAYYLS